MLIERLNSAKNLSLYEGDRLDFRLYGEEEDFDNGTIEELRADIQAIVINDRIIPLKDIEMLRQSRGLAKAAGYGLQTFGAAWGFFALIGYNTDGDPDSQVGVGDGIVTAVGLGGGYLIRKVFGTKRLKMDGNYRLRVVDVTF